MLTLKLKVAAILTLALATPGAGLVAYGARQPDLSDARQKDDATAQAKPERTEAKGERTDGRGDPLPEGALHRFGSARLRHGGGVRASALSPDGKTLATAGARSVIVWNLETGKALHRFPCDLGNAYSRAGLAFSPDGRRLGYVRDRFFACVWDLQVGKELRRLERRFEDRQGWFSAGFCQFANGGKELVVFTRAAIETWNIESGLQTASVPTRAAMLSADGKMFLRIENAVGLTLGDARTGTEVLRLPVRPRHDGIEDGLAFSPDGKMLALVNAQTEMQLRDAARGTILATFPVPSSTDRLPQGGREYRLGFSADSKTLFLGASGGIIHRWDVADRKELPPLNKHQSAVAGMHTLPDGRTLVSTGQDGVTLCWDLKTGQPKVDPESYAGRSMAAYSSDGRFVAVGDVRGRIDLWDGRGGQLIRTVQREGAGVAHLAFSPDGKHLAAAQRSGTVQFWQVPSGRAGDVWRREPVWGERLCNGILFSPDGRWLYVSDYPKQIRIVEVASGKLLWKGDGSPLGEAFAPDGATLLVGRAGPYLAQLDARTGEQRAKVRIQSNIPDGIGTAYALAFSPDARRLAVADAGGGLMLCDARTCAETQRLAAGSSWTDLARSEEMGGKMPNRIRTLAFSIDGTWLASAGTDGTIGVWETATGKEVLHLAGHEAEVTCVAFAPDGRAVFSHGQDGQGYLWNLEPKRAPGRRAALADLWADLTGADAGKAYRALWALSADPRGVALLREKLPPAAVPEKARVAKLIADLDSDSFDVRQAATQALAELAELTAPALEESRKATSSAEQRTRLERLLTSLSDGTSPAQLLRTRAVQAARLAGTAEARQVLREWARGAAAARLTREAQGALDRLDNHKQ